MLNKTIYYLRIVSFILYLVITIYLLPIIIKSGKTGIFFLVTLFLFVAINLFSMFSKKEIYIKTKSYNLIIIDDEMKPISGLETLKRLRKENINIPAIIMLDEGKEHIKNHYIKDGFIDYILKSDIKNEINRIIKKML